MRRYFLDPFGVLGCVFDAEGKLIIRYSILGRPDYLRNHKEVAFGHGDPQEVALIVIVRRSVPVEDGLLIFRRHDFPACWVESVVVPIDIE